MIEEKTTSNHTPSQTGGAYHDSLIINSVEYPYYQGFIKKKKIRFRLQIEP
jgi:hypothetical protein